MDLIAANIVVGLAPLESEIRYNTSLRMAKDCSCGSLRLIRPMMSLRTCSSVRFGSMAYFPAEAGVSKKLGCPETPEDLRLRPPWPVVDRDVTPSPSAPAVSTTGSAATR